MNQHVTELLRDNYTTVGIRLRPEETATVFTYKILSAEKDRKYRVNDYVLVPAPESAVAARRLVQESLRKANWPLLKVGKIVEIHDTEKLDFEAEYQYKWVVCPIYLDTYNSLMQEDAQLIEQFKKMVADTARENVRRAFFEQFPQAQALLLK